MDVNICLYHIIDMGGQINYVRKKEERLRQVLH